MPIESIQQDMFTVLHGEPVPVVTRWTYDASDPFAVSFAVQTRNDRWIEWFVARDLVVAAFDGPAGEGDIRMSPQLVAGYDIVEFEARSTGGRAVLEVDRALLRRFIDSSIDVVALGHEAMRMDLDKELAKITRSCAG
ncbi:SsgA family sporulation/cell division regulator [Pseudonocardia asaccharolytica]|uniref:Sporulation protein SsgA n=2 Tax=Pseudonocardia asaccharolytica TaxID=54010 RepID=A0A511CXZ7_9PSEU|nr:SsgA family sporulation/cell division regulator [Pseudonocardia asaccharolytica]GEL17123.1 sporulation protein SsgA [Pseudonocardia asaccharolytica DSM 44247 = NBRC 16224]